MAEIVVTGKRSPARQPRAIVRLNGAQVPGWISWEVLNNSYYEADTFRVSFACSGMSGLVPTNNAVSSGGSAAAPGSAAAMTFAANQGVFDPGSTMNWGAWFSTQALLFVEILAGFPHDPVNPNAGELKSLIYGRVDDIHFDPVQQTIELSGRDLTGVLIDARIADEFANQSASNIAIIIAQEYGLTPIVTATSGYVGTAEEGNGSPSGSAAAPGSAAALTYAVNPTGITPNFAGTFDGQQTNFPFQGSPWDLLTQLARGVGFVCYVTGQELHFEPAPSTERDPYVVNWQAVRPGEGTPNANVTDISFARNLTVTRGVAVTAMSPNFATGKTTVRSYPSSPKGIQAGKAERFGGVQAYFFTLPADMSPVQVESYAQAQYDAIVSHEMKMHMRLPADNILTTTMPISVRGTGTRFDQLYYARSITREMSINEGYVMTVEAQNVNADVSPES